MYFLVREFELMLITSIIYTQKKSKTKVSLVQDDYIICNTSMFIWIYFTPPHPLCRMFYCLLVKNYSKK